MSRSKKRMPGCTCGGNISRKKGKQVCNRKFRRKEHVLLHQREELILPQKPMEVMDTWDIGGDGKCFFGFHPDEDWFMKLMRK